MSSSKRPETPADAPANATADTTAESTSAEGTGVEETAAEPEEPLNRAARRAKAKKAAPSHVGPQAGFQGQQGRGPRSHTKRRIG
ncbi:hypothetical protein [Pseudonocardia sp. TRM90224]|uniref:hypothetical protein n=1 Tax=Pseudonocardia sp. TRM90224 TaxID=2812678 RepID=UPI001E507675|nr:hypothetical protein [Pseudonocardia sp. TRM90224]